MDAERGGEEAGRGTAFLSEWRTDKRSTTCGAASAAELDERLLCRSFFCTFFDASIDCSRRAPYDSPWYSENSLNIPERIAVDMHCGCRHVGLTFLLGNKVSVEKLILGLHNRSYILVISARSESILMLEKGSPAICVGHLRNRSVGRQCV